MKLRIKADWFSSIIISLVLFANLVIGNSKYIMYVYILMGISLLYCLVITLRKFHYTAEAICSRAFVWTLFCGLWMFVYGFFGPNPESYSLVFHLLVIFSVLLILIILYHHRENILDVMTRASIITILLMSSFIVSMNGIDISSLLLGSFQRIGYTAVGNINTTTVSYSFLVIPVFYKFFVLKRKSYLPIIAVALFFMFMTGSKKSFFLLVIMVVICTMGVSKNRNQYISRLFRVIISIGIVMMVCYMVPVLNEMVFSRVIEMFETLDNINMSDQTSTALRVRFIFTAFTKGWDRPLFGHGWGSFAKMYGYSSLYKMGLYTHCNYAEIFFSFGIIGLLLFYYLPIYEIRMLKKCQSNPLKILAIMYIACLLFIDFGTVTSYSSILGYLGFSIVHIIERTNMKNSAYVNESSSYKLGEHDAY